MRGYTIHHQRRVVFALFVLFGDDLCSKRNQLRHLFQIPFTPSSDSTRKLEKHFIGGDQSHT